MQRPAMQVDKQEAELRAEQRRLQIERANKILFDESDRVRSFHSQLQKADVIQENEALIDFKKQIGVLRKAQEAAFVEQQKQALEVRGQGNWCTQGCFQPAGGVFHSLSSAVVPAASQAAAAVLAMRCLTPHRVQLLHTLRLQDPAPPPALAADHAQTLFLPDCYS